MWKGLFVLLCLNESADLCAVCGKKKKNKNHLRPVFSERLVSPAPLLSFAISLKHAPKEYGLLFTAQGGPRALARSLPQSLPCLPSAATSQSPRRCPLLPLPAPSQPSPRCCTILTYCIGLIPQIPVSSRCKDCTGFLSALP